ncbi:MAG: PQQ-binding-like beta-propeller repeat protein, partial [Nitrososphaerota archaeon]|nr:PQQ-binding-like beta-propeller repeat protein [Nitrososphaerota archaeon]
MKKALAALLILLFIVIPLYSLSSASASTNTDWPMFRHDLSRNGNTNNNSSQANSAQLFWRFPTSASIMSSPAISENLIFFGCKDCNIYCINATTGTEIWHFPT